MKRTVKNISVLLTLALVFSLFACVLPTSANTYTDEEIQALVEQSKLDTGDKYDDNIFNFEIVNLTTLNDTLTAAYQTDIAARSETYTNLTSAIEAINAQGISVQLSIDNTQLTQKATVTSFSSVMSEKNADLSLPYAVMAQDVCVKRVCDSTNGHTYSGLKTGVVYTAEFTVEQNARGVADTREYIGNFGIGFNEDYTLYCEATVIDVTDLKAEADAVFAKGIPAETFSKPVTEITDNSTVYLNIEAGKNKYYTFTATESGFVDTVLYSPEAADAKITVKKVSDGATVADIEARPEYLSAGSRHSEAVFNRFYAHSGEAYAIIIEGADTSGASVLSTFVIPSPTWYPQWSASVDGTRYWDDNHLINLYVNNRQFTDNSGGGDDLMSDACRLCCVAMIMRDLNKVVSSKFDIREYSAGIIHTGSAYLTNLESDPYSAFLANNNFIGNEYSYTNSKYVYTVPSTQTYNGVTINYWNTLMTAFGATTSKTPKTFASYDALFSELTTVLTAHPEGVYVYFSNHSIIIRNINGNLRVFDTGRVTGKSDTFYYYNVPLYAYFELYNVRSVSSIQGYRTFD